MGKGWEKTNREGEGNWEGKGKSKWEEKVVGKGRRAGEIINEKTNFDGI